jgi:hypothetical protein
LAGDNGGRDLDAAGVGGRQVLGFHARLIAVGLGVRQTGGKREVS